MPKLIKKPRKTRFNLLGPTGFSINVSAIILILLSGLCLSRIILSPMIGGILAIAALVASSVGLTMAVIARFEIVQNVQRGDEIALSGMVVGIIMCVLSLAAIAVWFILYL